MQKKRVFFAILVGSLIGSGCNDFLTKDVAIGVKDGGNGGGGGDDGVAQPDDDDDGLGNSVEEALELQPRSSDSDADGFGDGIEFVNDDGDPLNSNATPKSESRAKILPPGEIVSGDTDSDGDGLGDQFEGDNSLESDNPDTDEDGFADGLELIAGSDPFDGDDRPRRESPPASDGTTPGTPPADGDRDGLSDTIEERNGTTTTRADSDGDGWGDGLELLTGSNGNNPASVPNIEVPEPPATTTTTVTSTTLAATTDDGAASEE